MPLGRVSKIIFEIKSSKLGSFLESIRLKIAQFLSWNLSAPTIPIFLASNGVLSYLSGDLFLLEVEELFLFRLVFES
jgi:hypothetical protein